ncbi:MAG: GNAT family N-acetyltransferase [Candidatus Nanopelagicales bacterium]
MRFRPADGSDYAAVIAAVPAWWWRDVSPLLQELFFTNFGSTSTIVEDGSGDLAAFLIGFPSVDDPQCAYVHFIGVRPDLRGSGLGADLHARFAQAMAQRGVTTIRCVTNELNADSIAFHQRVGFAIESVSDGHMHFVRTIGDARFAPRSDPRPADPPWGQAAWPPPPGVVLTGRHVTLAPATVEDSAELFGALDDDAVWAHVRDRPVSADGWAQAIAAAPEAGRFPWAVRRGGQVVGTTSFLEASAVDARLEIGFTLYARDVWGTSVNPECKLLLLQWAFDRGFGRVQLKTDIRNARSQQALARLGARYEGVLRRYQRRSDGSVRDTVLFSVTAEDWPEVRAGLEHRLATR